MIYSDDYYYYSYNNSNIRKYKLVCVCDSVAESACRNLLPERSAQSCFPRPRLGQSGRRYTPHRPLTPDNNFQNGTFNGVGES